MTIKAIVWGENIHEHTNEVVGRMYPNGMHNTIADALNEHPNITATTATLQEPDHGLSEARLKDTDVLLWWGHCAHGDVQDEIVDRVQKRVLEGMGLIVLHSGHFSKIFKRLMGTMCSLKWREAGESERLFVVNPGHPIVQGLGEYIELEHEEMYGEPFSIPNPDEVIFISSFEGGEVFRSGVTYKRGNGNIFYFRPGHETYPTYYNKDVCNVLRNAVVWAKHHGKHWIEVDGPNVPPEQAPDPVEVKGEGLHRPGDKGFK
jgi:trehalose utilization protein